MSDHKFERVEHLREFLSKRERKTNIPLKRVFVSFDTRDEVVNWAQSEKMWLNTISLPNGTHGVYVFGTDVFPSNQLVDKDILVDAKNE